MTSYISAARLLCLLFLFRGCQAFAPRLDQRKRRHICCRSAEEDTPETAPRKHRDIVAEDEPRKGFFMATRALRGEYDPAAPEYDHERSAAALLPALVEGFPTRYPFTVVGKLDSNFSSHQQFADHLIEIVATECGDNAVQLIEIAPRLSGKYVSVRIDSLVQSPTMIQRVFEVLKAQNSVKMSF